MGSIKALPEAVKSTMRSGFIIGGLTTVVEELVYNSLDAGSTKVSVYVGVNNGYVKVEDNGSGISRDGLVLLGERYATSKLNQFHDKDDGIGSFGFRGEVLCSIADISLIEITTKVHGRANGYQKVMKGRKCLYFGIDNNRRDVGTTVIARDLFYNQPVRRRKMQSSAKKVLHSIKECAVRIALVQPRVSFKVVDMESEDELLCTHASSSPLSLICNKFGIEASSLRELSFSEGSLKLEGYVSGPSSSFPSKAIQYIYVNSRFVTKGPFHKVLNRLADMYWDQLSCDKGGKRGQPNLGPMYCLNLRCPHSSYDLNLEFSRTTVEFKDWSPVIAFIEQSVASLWSKRTKMGEYFNCEAYQIGKRFEEKNILGDMASGEKDWLLRTCEISTKRRRIQSSGDEQALTIFSPCSKNMNVEDDSDLSIQPGIGRVRKNAQRNDVKFGESETSREFCNQMDSSESGCVSPVDCNFIVIDDNADCLFEPDKGVLSFNEDLLDTDVTIRKSDGNFGEGHFSSSRWRDEHRVDDTDSMGSQVDSEWSFELRQKNNRNKAIDDPKKFLHDLVQPLDYDKNSRFQIDNLNGRRSHSNSTGSEDDGFCHSSILLRAQCKNQPANVSSLYKFNTESDMWNNHNTNSTKCHDLFSFDKEYMDIGHDSESPSEQNGGSANSFSLDTDQHSAVSYPFFSSWDLEHRHLIPDEGLERRCNARNYDDIESKDDKGKFCFDYLGDIRSYENYSSTSYLHSTSLFQIDNARVEKAAHEISPGRHSIDDLSSVRYSDFSVETFLPCMDLRWRDYWHFPPVCQSASEVKTDVERYHIHDSEHFLGERLGRDHHCLRDGLLSPRCYDTVADDIFSPCLDFQKKLCTHEISIPCVSPASTNDYPKTDHRTCQVPEPNCVFSEQTGTRCLRLRRSHSAPPVYRGKRRFLSVMNCLISTAGIPAVRAAPQDSIVTVRRELEHSPGQPLINCEQHQRHEPSYAEEQLFCFDQDVKETSNIMQVSTWVQDDMTETACGSPGYLKQIYDSDMSRIKWRAGFEDAAAEDIANKQHVGDTFNQVENEIEILDVHSCMLHLAGESLIPKSINRNCLESTKVLLQVDNKFIPVVASGILAVIDQHAADERIRLEEMRKKVLSGEMKSVTYLQEEKDLVLPEMAYQLLCNYAEHVQQWGWICNIFSQDSGFAKNLNLLNAQPTHLRLLAVPCVLGVNLSDVDLLEFLEQLADTDGSSTIPPSVLRVLNSKACRGAIMFGDKLLPSECSLIVEELKRTSLCFQCAHGRPTTVPLVNLKALHEGVSQLRSWREEGSNKSWHGLRREDINVRRAKLRLDVSRGCG